MHRAARVDGIDARAGLLDDPHHVGDARQHAAPMADEPLLGRLAVDVLHHEVGRVAVLAERVDGEHVGMRQARHRARLLGEEVLHLRHAHHRRLDELDRDTPLEALVERSGNDAHAADAEHALDAIGASDEGALGDAYLRERIT